MFDQVATYIKMIDWSKRLKKELPVLKEVIEKHDSSKSLQILDLGCGPGIHLKKLAKTYPNHQFYGIDSNKDFIQYAQDNNRTDGNLHYMAQDFWDMELDQIPTFDFVYSLGNSLMLIWGKKGPVETFIRLIKILNSKASLFFQILNSDTPRQGYRVSKIMHSTNGREYFTMKHFSPDLTQHLMNVDFLTLYRTKEQTKYQIEKHSAIWKLISYSTLKTQMKELGFIDQVFWGNYAKQPFLQEKSDSLLFLGQLSK